MSTLKLIYPVHTLENQLLFPAGTELSTETLDDFISSKRTPSFKTDSLLRYGSVKNDLLHFFSQPLYHTIFSDKEQVADLMNFMESINLALPVLQPLDYFKEQDFYTYRHSLMVFAMSALLGRDLITDYQDLIQEAATGPTHDMGKICVPLPILKKITPLTRKEQSILAHHSAAGYVLLSYYLQDTQTLAAKAARDHHERKDGSGYPRGILLMDLVVEIIVVCDIYDALISPRPYRPVSYDNRTALEEITGMAEKKVIGWEVVKTLISHNRKFKPDYKEAKVSFEKRGTPPLNNLYGVISEEKNTI